MILLPQRIGFKDDLLPKKEQRGCVCGLLEKFWINTLIDGYFDGVYQPSQRICFFYRLAVIQKTPSRPRFKPEKVISSVAKWLCPKTSDLDIQKPGWWFGTWFLFFHSVGNVIIPTDFHSYFSEGLVNHQPENCWWLLLRQSAGWVQTNAEEFFG